MRMRRASRREMVVRVVLSRIWASMVMRRCGEGGGDADVCLLTTWALTCCTLELDLGATQLAHVQRRSW